MTNRDLLLFDADAAESDLTHLPPIPSYEESIASPPLPSPSLSTLQEPQAPLQILAATWGGVTVTPDIQSLVAASGTSLTLDLRALHRLLSPDPAPGTTKVLSVLYRLVDENGNEGARLLVVSEDAKINGPPRGVVVIGRGAAGSVPAQAQAQAQGRGAVLLHARVDRPWRAGARGQVEILGVVYGPRRVEDAAVLVELGEYFEGRRRQVRVNNAFFGGDPWPYKRKSWTVFFRFVGGKRVQVVTGWEDGALEVPWSRDL
ncbi:hypothetical protein C8A05DRAFT_42268 [Staphylotrichum tortipilum]|uniref:Uncharacterized protein n=1 Tax=Staphylotrichum tortipilum TaxID=2831512 RepID=A0AAN6MQR1_9PEZI|nr:hypothetical protein C8A05DRAFT_42268 [Staphylotrichum longicolle]